MDKKEIIDLIRQNKTVGEIANYYEVSRNTLYYHFRKWKFDPQQCKFDHGFFEDINSELKAYWLGFIMADGCVVDSCNKVVIKLSQKDADHLSRWHKDIDSCLNLCFFGNAVASSHYSDKMCSDLIKHGCTPRKSLTLQFPTLSSDLHHHFVRGYFDGDGCAGWHTNKRRNPHLRLTFLGTSQFLLTLRRILSVRGNVRPSVSKAFTLSSNGNIQSKRIRDWMYQEANVFLPRKREVCYSNL